ncbi:tripartite tricarboxylate transporter substrate binding protein [Salisediminibacterium beveridgei]|uniref:Tricarboxylate transport protein TctC n=1 Tax=Salisediminibacterium beveridgei TaxID=632773 RepID=A0A1D7QX12_9BACI|nr:tripartite tricarboxylate transporter substrate binding protein [Salisediminibacterium beveridgei]AOM83545.1 Tricarboxylate transport protein TctC [Salisediminibacterium beveridgei]
MKKAIGSLLVVSAVLLAACNDNAESQSSENYPEKDIDVIVTWSSGGGTDITARQFLQAAEEETDASFLVRNVTGGAGAVGWNEARQSESDGYTLTVLTADILIHSANEANVTLDDFEPIALMSQYPAVIAVDADSEWEDLDDFIETANERKLSIANDGLGQNDHLTAMQLEEEANLDNTFDHIPFDGGAEGIAAVLGGNVDATISNVPEIASRSDMKVLAIFSQEENEEMPDTPVIKEYGMDIDAGSFRMIAAPAGTPEESLSYLDDLFETAYNSPTYLDFAEESNLSPQYMNREDSKEMLNSRLDVMTQLLEKVE